jgi:class 3 adenylate cyclase/DNA-binding transcriptional MerR regulator
MEAMSEAELAERAGTTADRVRRLVELGIVAPEADGTYRAPGVQRVRFAAALEQSGISLQDISTLIATSRLSFSFIDLLFPTPAAFSSSTYRQFSAERGLSMDVIEAIHEAIGLPSPSEDELVREDDAAMFPMAQLALGLGLDTTVLARVLRVYGENLRRIAQAEPAFYHTYVELPLLRSGMTEMQMRELATEMSTQLIPVIERLILWIYQRHFEHYTIEHIVEHVEAAMEEAGFERSRTVTPPAIAFLDLTGYTRLTEEQGDEVAAELAASLAGLVQRESQRRGGRPVKWLGDGVMFHFPDPGQAVLCGVEMVEQAPASGLPQAHVGVNAGPVVFRDGDYFGRTVNVAARIAGRAGPSEILVSQDVVELAGVDGVRFEEIGPVELKGVSHPVVLHRALRDGR